MAPQMTLASPRKRICPSLMRSTCSKMRRQPPGLKKVSSPSSTSISASAASKVSDISRHCRLLAPGRSAGSTGAGSAAAAAHRLEEIAARIDHHQVRLAAEGLTIRLEAAIERRELWIASECSGIDGRSLRIALALDPLGIAVSLRDDHLSLLVGVGADHLGLGRAGRA